MTYHYQKPLLGAAFGFAVPSIIYSLNNNPIELATKFFRDFVEKGLIGTGIGFVSGNFVWPLLTYHRMPHLGFNKITDMAIENSPKVICAGATLGTAYSIVNTAYKNIQKIAAQHPSLLKISFVSAFLFGYVASEEIDEQDVVEPITEQAQCLGNMDSCEADIV